MLSMRFRGMFTGIFDHSSRSTFVSSETDVGREGLDLTRRSNSSQMCSIKLRSGRLNVWNIFKMCYAHQSLINMLGQTKVPQTLSSMSLCTLLCALVHNHDGRGRDHLQTVPTKLEAWSFPKSLGMLKHSEFLLLELRGDAQYLKTAP
ncbi:hypothetical protein XENORESO_015479 [Xenotaenia resolanae]|uniref:Uncharacterized protein n=1 Tax=Xenotaenia resolanae TaxID=208358 RepID=A0ABV0WBZ2_9TELE